MKALLTGLVFVLMSGPCMAQEVPVFGPGASSCKAVLEESERMGSPVGNLDAVFQGWILGYLSGLNRSELAILEVDSSVIARSVYSHCSENPDDALFFVVDLLYDGLKTTQSK